MSGKFLAENQRVSVHQFLANCFPTTDRICGGWKQWVCPWKNVEMNHPRKTCCQTLDACTNAIRQDEEPITHLIPKTFMTNETKTDLIEVSTCNLSLVSQILLSIEHSKQEACAIADSMRSVHPHQRKTTSCMHLSKKTIPNMQI